MTLPVITSFVAPHRPSGSDRPCGVAPPRWIGPNEACTWLPDSLAPVGSPEWIAQLEIAWLHIPQIEIPIIHRFAGGVYIREMQMPADNIVLGNEHIHAHHNILLSGRASVLVEGVFHQVHAGTVFTCTPGVRKVIVSHENLRWATIHATTVTDPDLVEDGLVIKSPALLAHRASLKSPCVPNVL